jgi:hypothetical protein
MTRQGFWSPQAAPFEGADPGNGLDVGAVERAAERGGDDYQQLLAAASALLLYAEEIDPRSGRRC